MGSGCSKPEGPIQIPDHVARTGFPHTIQLTWMKSCSKSVIRMAAPGLPPLYSIDMPQGYGGHTILYLGASTETSPMAYITRSGSEFTFNLPGVMGSGIMPSQVEMVCEHPHTEVRYRFTMMVWHGTSGRSESFEWRRSSGNEVKSLGGSSSGWKLVRLGSNSGAGFPPPYQQHGINNNATPQYHYGYPQQNASSYDEKPEPGFSSDGNEVVAVFAPAKTFSFSMTDVGKFQYMRSGATPTMGYHWALMAVLSGVCVYQHQLARANNATGSTAAASAAGAVVGAVAGV